MFLIIGKLAAAAMLAGGVARAAPDAVDPRAPFEWKQEIRGGLEPGGLYRICVPNDVFDGCHFFPNDVRMLDAAGRSWPFYLWVPAPKEDTVALPAKTRNTSLVEGPEGYVRQDLRIPPDEKSGSRRMHTEVVVQTPGRDFVRRVEVRGSEDGREWALLGVGYLVDYSRDAQVVNRTVRYPVSDYPFLQVRVYPDARNALERPEISRILVQFQAGTAGEWEDVEPAESEAPRDDAKESCQVLVFDLGARHRPVEAFLVRAAGEYARSLRIHGRDTETNLWRWICDAEIHSVGGHVRDRVDVSGFAYRWLKLEVFHYDDRPLDRVRVKACAVPRYLVFEVPADSAGGAWRYGSASPDAPRFDLRRRRGDSEGSAAPLARLGPREATRAQRPSPWARYGRWIALVVVGAVSLLVIGVVANMMRRVGTD